MKDTTFDKDNKICNALKMSYIEEQLTKAQKGQLANNWNGKPKLIFVQGDAGVYQCLCYRTYKVPDSKGRIPCGIGGLPGLVV